MLERKLAIRESTYPLDHVRLYLLQKAFATAMQGCTISKATKDYWQSHLDRIQQAFENYDTAA